MPDQVLPETTPSSSANEIAQFPSSLSPSLSPAPPPTTFSDLYPHIGEEDPLKHPESLKIIRTLVSMLTNAADEEDEQQSPLWAFLYRCYGSKLEESSNRYNHEIRLANRRSLELIHAQNGKDFSSTWIQSRLRKWLGELEDPKGKTKGEGSQTSSTRQSVKFPDLSFRARMWTKMQEWEICSLVLEMKAHPDDPHYAILAIAQDVMYLLTAWEQCGCWVGVAFHCGRFTRIVVIDDATIAIETTRDEAETSLLTIEQLLRQDEWATKFPWQIAKDNRGDADGIRTLWQTSVTACRMLGDAKLCAGLQRIAPPNRGSDSTLQNLATICGIREDKSPLRLLSAVRPRQNKSCKRRLSNNQVNDTVHDDGDEAEDGLDGHSRAKRRKSSVIYPHDAIGEKIDENGEYTLETLLHVLQGVQCVTISTNQMDAILAEARASLCPPPDP